MKIMQPILQSTIREYFRKSVILLVLLFAAGLIVGSWFIAPFTLGETSKIVRDVGLAAITLTSIIMALVLGSRLLYRDIKKKALYCLLTRPATTGEIVIGKFLGIAIILFYIECALHLILQFMLLLIEGAFSPALLVTLPYALLETYIILGVVFLFSSFSTPVMGTGMGIMCYLLGHAAFDIKAFATQPNAGISGTVAHILYFVIPNLEHFNIRMEIVHRMPLSFDRMLFSLCYGIAYVLVLIIASALLFRKRQYP
ncbi:ABC transporter permease [candidate division WOR-3 bacterium]|nr:ABC transporter permease [candidate division WOR-3 bacterium]